MTEPTQPAPDAQPGLPAAWPEPAPPALVPAAPPPAPPPVAYAAPPPPPPGRRPAYSMVTTFDESVTMSRLWGIPFLGVAFRGILLIPHYVVLFFYALVVALALLVTWIPVLVNGRFPGWGYALIGGYLRWVTRVWAYAILAAAAYPPFSTTARHDVDVRWDEAQPVARWAGIPLLGVVIRGFLLIPHLFVLYFLGIAVGFLNLITWFPVLVDGRYADWAYRIVGGFIRWQNRVTSYLLLMTGPYPPLGLDD